METVMKNIFAISLAAAILGTLGLRSARASSAPLTASNARAEVVILPEPLRRGGELIMKIVALNRTQHVQAFGPDDIRIATARGTTVPLMSLAALLAQTRGRAGASGGTHSYEIASSGGPTVTYNRSGQPNLQNFAGGDTEDTQIASRRRLSGLERRALQRQRASLKAAILQPMRIAPGQVHGGEVVTRAVRFGRHEPHFVHVDVEFAGARYTFTIQARRAR